MKGILTSLKNRSINLFLKNPSGERSKEAAIALATLRKFQGDFRQERVLTSLRSLDQSVFRELLMKAYGELGYLVKASAFYSGELINEIIDPQGLRYFVKANQVTEADEVTGLADFIQLVEEKKVIGFFIHTGRTSGHLSNIVKETRVEIVSGDKLVTLVGPYQSAPVLKSEIFPQTQLVYAK